MTRSKRRIIQYLLGELSPSERQALEDRYFSDLEAHAEFSAVEYALIDDYVGGRLPADERERFEQHYMQLPSRRERVNTARALLRQADRFGAERAAAKASTSRWPLVALAAAAVILLAVGGVWLQRQGEQFAPSPSPGTIAENGQTPALTPTPAPSPETAAPLASPEEPREAVLALSIHASNLRGEGGRRPRLVLPPDTRQAILRVNLADIDGSRFQAHLDTVDGARIADWPPRPAHRDADGDRFLSFPLPASRLKTGDYMLRVEAISGDTSPEEIGVLTFNVHRP